MKNKLKQNVNLIIYKIKKYKFQKQFFISKITTSNVFQNNCKKKQFFQKNLKYFFQRNLEKKNND